MPVQNYEEYWSFTLAFTDFNGKKFLNTLKICVDFIERNKAEEFSKEKYSRLQAEVKNYLKIGEVSVRKAINQLVKMGFLNSFLTSYNFDSVEYINAKTNRKRKSLLSKIVYSNSSFNRSVETESNLHQLNFLIKTLVENGKLHKEEIIALMLVDIKNIKNGFLNKEELSYYIKEARRIGFIERKYNQVSYLYNLLGKLDNLVFVADDLYFEEDAKIIFGDEFKENHKVRDPYLHRLYKNQLQEESVYVCGEEKCMLEKLAYPVLIASHIKPFIKSTDDEAYDANNGLLLSRNMDMLFDLGYISFEENGKIILSNRLDRDVKKYLERYVLDGVFINEKRLTYLDYHRNNILT